MHRTEGLYNDGGLFADGPPGTRIEQEWLNAVQEEIAYVIEQNNIALKTASDDTRTQLYLSILNMIPGVSGIRGMEISNNTGDPDADIDFATGACFDDTYTVFMNQIISMTKKLDVTFAEGTNQGMLDVGAVAADTWYYFFLIRKDSDGSLDYLASTSPTSPTMPSGYTYKRRVRGAVLTDGGGNILGFYQKDNYFWYDVMIKDYSTGAIGTSKTLVTVSVPPNMIGMFSIYNRDSGTQNTVFGNPDQTDTAPGEEYNHIHIEAAGVCMNISTEILTDSSSQIFYRTDNVTFLAFKIFTKGFIDSAQS